MRGNLWVACVMLMLAPAAWATEGVEIVKAEGLVQAADSLGKEERAVTASSKLGANCVISTGAKGRAVVKVPGTGYVVLERNSKIEVGGQSGFKRFFRHVTGMVYYAVNKVRGDNGVAVRTATATLGIRGTRFLVTDVPGRSEIGMRKGLIKVESLAGEFELHKLVEQEEFNEFKREAEKYLADEQKEFEDYKKSAQREIVEYRREFELGKDRMVSFDGMRAHDRPLSTQVREDLGNAEKFAEEYLREIRD